MRDVCRTALIAAVALVVAGCGSGDDRSSLSKAEYERRAAPIVTEATSGILKLSVAISRAPLPRLAISRIETLRAKLRKAAGELEALDAPAEARSLHADLVAGLREAAAELDTLERETGTSPPGRMLGFADEFTSSPGVQKLSRALEDLRTRGYRLGPRE